MSFFGNIGNAIKKGVSLFAKSRSSSALCFSMALFAAFCLGIVSVSNAGALATSPRNRSSMLIAEGIFGRELMTVYALPSTGICRRWTFTSKRIRPGSHWLKMPRVETSSVSAEMVQMQIGGNLTTDNDVRESVRYKRSASKSYLTVSSIGSSWPVPARLAVITERQQAGSKIHLRNAALSHEAMYGNLPPFSRE